MVCVNLVSSVWELVHNLKYYYLNKLVQLRGIFVCFSQVVRTRGQISLLGKACFLCVLCTGDIQTYRRHTNIWECPNIWGIQTYRECTNVWGHTDTPLVWQSMLFLCCVCTGGIQTYGGFPSIWGHLNIQGCTNYGGIWTPPKSDKACFLCDVCSTGASNWVSQLPEDMHVKLATYFSQLWHLVLYEIFAKCQ